MYTTQLLLQAVASCRLQDAPSSLNLAALQGAATFLEAVWGVLQLD